ncbi:DUF2142 domain-containing protein [Microvirga terrestris]|uniref:DUF2142 domain-containing protein n=1 Tax=Microvirga terrestris TaxID=2791024 RepID=A0ABS0HSH9_9HYPH|nr:DUF2142 domain-containing protein [Microvirga terrestris]MBF9196439.1 DUF2142 domain-containing protein [Microvirga terrestris]
MASRTHEQTPAWQQLVSWKNRIIHTLDAYFASNLVGRIYSPRFLPLIYLAICIPVVLFLVFFRQPLGNPDELSHVARAYQISRGVLLTEEASPGLHPKGMVDKAWFQLGSQVSRRRFENLQTSLPIFKRYDWAGTEELKRFNSSVYFPAAFIPQAIGLKIAQKLHLHLVQSLQLASLLNAVVSLLVIALAIHLAAGGKYIIALVGALPMTLHQIASASPDGLIAAGALLMCSLTISALIRSKVSRSTLVGVVILGAITAATKLPYAAVAVAALIALWWVEPRSAKVNIRYVIACMAMITIPLIWTMISNASAVKHSMVIQTTPSDQLAFLLSHPLEIPGIAFSTLYRLSYAYLKQMIGVLGWLDAPLPQGVYLILYFGLATTLAMEGLSLKPLLRWTFLVGLAASAAMIFVSLYLIWTPLGSLGPIEGVQGRYFLPLLPFLVFLVPKPKHLASEGLKISVFTICGLVGGLATVATIIKRYYGVAMF